MTEVSNPYNPYKRALTAEDQDNIRKLMAANPVIDELIAQTMVLMPPEDLKEIIEKHKQGTLIDPFPTAKVDCYTIQTGKVEPEEEVVEGFSIKEVEE